MANRQKRLNNNEFKCIIRSKEKEAGLLGVSGQEGPIFVLDNQQESSLASDTLLED